MSNDNLRKRLERLQARLNAEYSSRPGASMKIVIVHGGLLSEPIFAMAGENEWFRERAGEDPAAIFGEDLDMFADRCAKAARELGEQLLVIGGLPATQRQHDTAMAVRAMWDASDDGVPPALRIIAGDSGLCGEAGY
jgi:hypothetical protein